ncbi:DUF6580 family putative transport protein [Granulicella cerasi]|uniref:DUF6580 family putative transport protein n=1 Tax=Granulicella cerasi TaxID=741063 RepID=A0ABW1ZC82_9BACT|nr:DUF6580 family putative transport protein [Granulicella cerasi]
MLAFIILFLAALSRFLPHSAHGTAVNFTAVGAGLLFFGSRRPRWEAIVAVAVMAVTDAILTRVVYEYPFHIRGYIVTWCWYAAVCLIGSALLRKVTALRVVAGVLASATGFFLLSNFVVWVSSGMYAHTAAGLGDCYAAAVPFYVNDLISTAIFAAAFFGLPALIEITTAEEPVPVRVKARK